MKVILRKDVDHLGYEGDVVDVKPGYGRNFLIPQGLARLATEGAMRAWEEERRQAARRLASEKGDAQRVADDLEDMVLLIPMRAGEDGRLFGTVTNQQLTVELAKHGFEMDRRNVTIEEEVRTTGTYYADVRVHPDVTARVKFEVSPLNA